MNNIDSRFPTVIINDKHYPDLTGWVMKQVDVDKTSYWKFIKPPQESRYDHHPAVWSVIKCSSTGKEFLSTNRFFYPLISLLTAPNSTNFVERFGKAYSLVRYCSSERISVSTDGVEAGVLKRKIKGKLASIERMKKEVETLEKRLKEIEAKKNETIDAT